MFWLQNKKNNFPVRTLIWRPEELTSQKQLQCMPYKLEEVEDRKSHNTTSIQMSTYTIKIISQCILQPYNYQLGKNIVHEIWWYSCHVNINNLPYSMYSDRYFNTD